MLAIFFSLFLCVVLLVLRTDLNNSEIKYTKNYVFSWQGVCTHPTHLVCLRHWTQEQTPHLSLRRLRSLRTCLWLCGTFPASPPRQLRRKSTQGPCVALDGNSGFRPRQAANLVVKAEVLNEPDEHGWRPVVGAFQQQTFGDRLASLQLADLDTLVDSFLGHQTIGCPLTTCHTVHRRWRIA